MRTGLSLLFLALMTALGCKTFYPTTKDSITVISSASLTEHGKILTYSICGQCHLNPVTNTFIGIHFSDVPSFIGQVYSHNLTQNPNGLAIYSDAELFYLIKTGINKNGKFIPYMTRPNIADADLKAIIAYLRSNDSPVQSQDSVVGFTKYTFIGKMAMNSAKPQPYQTGITAPDPKDDIASGRYLVDQIGCHHCHSKSLLSINYLQPEKTKGYLAGGMAMKEPNGKTVHAANLTPDNETGTGKYSLEEFRSAIREGKARDGKTMSSIMPKFGHLSDVQIANIYAYLKSLPPVKHTVKK